MYFVGQRPYSKQPLTPSTFFPNVSPLYVWKEWLYSGGRQNRKVGLHPFTPDHRDRSSGMAVLHKFFLRRFGWAFRPETTGRASHLDKQQNNSGNRRFGLCSTGRGKHQIFTNVGHGATVERRSYRFSSWIRPKRSLRSKASLHSSEQWQGKWTMCFARGKSMASALVSKH